MIIEFDHVKDATNRQKHSLSLAEAARLDLDQATVVPDGRFDYGEVRFQAYGVLDGRLHVLAFTTRGITLRAISFRKANKREERRYGRRP